MSIIEAIILGIIQGLTEFIPVSSSGHLVIAQDLLGVKNGGLLFDIALHIGTLLALLIYFWRDIGLLIGGVLGRNKQYQRLAWFIVISTIPAVIGGLLLQDAAETTFRSPKLVAVNLGVVALFMIWAEKFANNREQTKLTDMSLKQTFTIGLAQVLALIPGVSRSGSTITTGLFAGVDRVAATRFSFLLAIPITFGAIIKVLTGSGSLAQINHDLGAFVVGALTAFISGVAAIRFLLKYLSRHSLAAFAYYRLALALVLIVLL